MLSQYLSHPAMVIQRLALPNQCADERPDDLVAGAERQTALAYQVVRKLRGGGEVPPNKLPHPLQIKGHCLDHLRDSAQAHLAAIQGIPQRRLVLLQVAIVAAGQRLHHRQDLREAAIDDADLPARQLRDAGVLLLRHDA